jgi:SAM-dependent methyltransferase
MTATVEQALNGNRDRAIAKTELILDHCRGRRVLDLGCIDHTWRASIDNPKWLHARIRAVASECTGVDYLADDVAELRSRGFDIVAGNVLQDDPPGTYEVVVAGDLIEHLEDPAAFLRYVHAALEPGGLAVITTPNPFYLGQTVEILLRGQCTVNPEHTAWYDPFTITELVERSPLAIRDVRWLEQTWQPLWNVGGRPARYARRALGRAIRMAAARRPYLNSDFAVVLEGRGDDSPPAPPSERAAAVNVYLGR